LIFDHCGRRWWWWWLIPWIENKNRICIYINILACTITSCSKKSSSSSSIKHIDRTCKEDQQISDRIHTQVINVNSLLYIYISWIELITVGYFFKKSVVFAVLLGKSTRAQHPRTTTRTTWTEKMKKIYQILDLSLLQPVFFKNILFYTSSIIILISYLYFFFVRFLYFWNRLTYGL
jgi:hypothetical protein